MSDQRTVLRTAEEVAEDVLFPAAAGIDLEGAFPDGHFDALAEAGLYGLAVPAEYGGPGLDPAGFARVLEILAGGCLATAFVWVQHHRALRAVAGSDRPGIRETWLAPLAAGERRAGLALAGQLPGEPRLRARRVAGGYELTGSSPWVTGWGLVDTLLVAARDEADRIVWLLLDAPRGPSGERARGPAAVSGEATRSTSGESPRSAAAAGRPTRHGGEGEQRRATLRAEPLRLAAVDASSTVTLRFDRHVVPEDRVTGSLPYAEWPERDAAGLRLNGSLALGVAARCGRLLELGDEDAALAACRHDLDAAGLATSGPDASRSTATRSSATGSSATGPTATGPSTTGPSATGPSATDLNATRPDAAGPDATRPHATRPHTSEPPASGPNRVDALTEARAAAAEFAMRRACALVVQRGARSVVRGDPGERLLREAGFLQVFGTRAAIKAELLDRWAHAPGA